MAARRQAPAAPATGETRTAQGERQESVPLQPHERDESATSQAADNPSARRMGKIAHDDLAQGREDTGKGPEMDATYEKMRSDEPGPGRGAA